jgi:soluble P-type ATPase
MIEIDIPGRATMQLRHLVVDYNGTLAVDGSLLPGVRELLAQLTDRVEIHVVTGDTFLKAQASFSGVRCKVTILGSLNQAEAKVQYVEQLGPMSCVCIGNGRNDRLMLRGARLGIVVNQGEGAAIETVLAADVMAPDIGSALALLLNPLRLTATLRG